MREIASVWTPIAKARSISFMFSKIDLVIRIGLEWPPRAHEVKNPDKIDFRNRFYAASIPHVIVAWKSSDYNKS